MLKTIKAWHLDLSGVKSIVKHSAWVAIISVAMYLLSLASSHDFGAYQAVATWGIGTIGAFIKKLAEEYQVPVENN